MPYQYKRELLTKGEVNRLATAGQTQLPDRGRTLLLIKLDPQAGLITNLKHNPDSFLTH